MADHVLNEIMSVTMDKLRSMVDVNTIVGTPINTPDGATLIPVSKVSLGFGTGGSDYGDKGTSVMFGGGSGAGITIVPVAFLAVCQGNVKLLPVAAPPSTTVDRIVELIPEIIDRINNYKKKKKADEDIDEDEI
jgi:sporulation protein YtfJ